MENSCAIGPAAELRVLPRCSVVEEGGVKETAAVAAKVVAAEEDFSEGSAATRKLCQVIVKCSLRSTPNDHQVELPLLWVWSAG